MTWFLFGWVAVAFAVDEVVVEEQADATNRKGASQSNVEVDDRFSGSDDVASAVALTPGTTIRRLGGLGAWSGVSIRGSTFRHVVVAIDGLPLNPDGAGAIDLSTLPLGAFKTVEVFRGVIPAHFGVAPMGGLVNLKTRGKPTGTVNLSFGSWSTTRLQAAAGGRQWMVATDAFQTASDYPYFSNRGTPFQTGDDAILLRNNQDKRQWSNHAHAKGQLGSVNWTVQNTSLVRDEGLPGPISRPAESARLNTRRSITQMAFEGAGEHYAGWARLAHIIRSERYRDPQGELGVDAQDQTDVSQTIGIQLAGARLWSNSATTHVGLRIRNEQLVRAQASEDAFEPLFDRWLFTAHIENPLFLFEDRLRIHPAFTGSWVPGETVGWAPQLAARWAVGDDVGLWASVGRGFRRPDVWELYGDRGNSTGNPDLVAESGWRGDLGVSVERQTIHWSLVAFAKRDEDRIIYVQNATATLVPVNFGQTRALGLETAGRVNFNGLFDLQGQASLTWTENLDERADLRGNRLPRVPIASGSMLAVFRPFESLQFGLGVTATAGNYWDATNWYLSPPRLLQNAWLRLIPHHSPIQFEISARNVWNQTSVQMPLDVLQPELGEGPQPLMDFSGYPLPGRTILVRVSWTGD